MYIIFHNKDYEIFKTKGVFTHDKSPFILIDDDELTTTVKMTNRINESVLNFLLDVRSSNMNHIVLTANTYIKDKLIKMDVKFLFYHPSDNIADYLNVASKLISKQVMCRSVPYFNIYRNPNQCASGILPMIYHNNELFCLLGIDNFRRKYSDFGGGFDKTFIPHRKDIYKNNVLLEKQIRSGKIHDDIFYDHYMTSSKSRAIINDLNMQNPKIGDGDINTQYTAFREFMEETCYLNDDNRVGYLFNIDIVFDKLYKNKSYVYLGGDDEYKYDMYVIFFTIKELNSDLVYWFNIMYEKYISDSDKYGRTFIDTVNEVDCFKIPQNKEMIGISMIPLKYIMSQINEIDYNDYSINKKKFAEEKDLQIKWEIHNNNSTYKISYHKDNYNAPILDIMRPCFADALVKYSKEIEFLFKTDTFEIIRPILKMFHY